jgi:hypothetical protein
MDSPGSESPPTNMATAVNTWRYWPKTRMADSSMRGMRPVEILIYGAGQLPSGEGVKAVLCRGNTVTMGWDLIASKPLLDDVLTHSPFS